MLKRRDEPYLPGRPKGPWWKWKRGPILIDAVLMYAQRGHGKRSSFYSDYTFGVWRGGPDGGELVPVGKAYFGFTDEELLRIDRFVRQNTISRFGPVREVVHQPERGLVLEVAFEGLQRSLRHKSGLPRDRTMGEACRSRRLAARPAPALRRDIVRHDAVDTLFAGLLGDKHQAELFAHHRRQKATDRVGLPTGCLHDGGNGYALFPMEHREDESLL
jgi:ATP-dependent DNA ligase